MCQINTTHANSLKEVFFKKGGPVHKEMEKSFFYEEAAEQPPDSLIFDRLTRSDFEQISHDSLISNCLGGGTGGTGIRMC